MWQTIRLPSAYTNPPAVMKFLKYILALILLSAFSMKGSAEELWGDIPLLTDEDKQHIAHRIHEEEANVDVKETIFHHLGDGYGWEVPFMHIYRIPLPVIVKAEDGKWFCFSSARLTEVVAIEDMETGKVKEYLVPVIHKEEKEGKAYYFTIAQISNHSNKVVQIFPLSEGDEEAVAKELAAAGEGEHDVVIDGYVNIAGRYYKEYRPLDISITKNVLALLIASVIVTLLVMILVRFYRRKGNKAPRRGMGFFEMLISFIYDGVIKSNLGKKADKFAPYLLTAFFFILIMNLLGLIVIFPGGANLTGNIAVTLVLAILTFIITNVLGTKHYWKEIFWPDVPLLLKFPLPIMQIIEVFGIFTKPAALCIRLFANMMGGHMIVITLTLLIFIFAAFGAAAMGAATVVSVLFSIFMLVLDVLVSFIQAYVFTLLSAMFIAMGQEEGHHHKDEHADEHAEEKGSETPAVQPAADEAKS